MAEVNATQLRDAVAWATNNPEVGKEASSNPFVWFWEAIEGDFNENRTTAQILVDAGISMIPLVDQVCDVRDLVADCKKIHRDVSDAWAWVSLVLTLIGLFPTLGSLVKGVLKIFFGFIRNASHSARRKAIEEAMTWVVAFLRRRDVQLFLKARKVDEVFHWLAEQIRVIRRKIEPAAIKATFDQAIGVIEELAAKVSLIPVIGAKAKVALEQVKSVRMLADEYLFGALKPVIANIDDIIRILERKLTAKQHGIVNTTNIHFRGAIPEAEAVALMRKRKPRWLSETGERTFEEVDVDAARKLVNRESTRFDNHGQARPLANIFPKLTEGNIRSFHTLATHAIRGPARLYRIIAPNSRALGDCWMSEEIFHKIMNSPNPKEMWRRYFGVWPDWNVNGQFVIFDVKAGETLNTWKGQAASQRKASLPNKHLEGGWEQIVFTVERGDKRADEMMYFKKKSGKETSLGKGMTEDEMLAATSRMNAKQREIFFNSHVSVRAKINHPSISGPFETGWGYEAIEGEVHGTRIGLPLLPEQITNKVGTI